MKKKLCEMSLPELWQLFPIRLTAYNPDWPNWYAAEADSLQHLLGTEVIGRIRHIGSTAVPGLTAKPTIDILLELNPGQTNPDDLAAKLRKDNWIMWTNQPPPDFRMDLGKGYTEEGFAEKVFHLHIRFLGDWNEPYFCAYLRQRPDLAQEYVRLKQQLAIKFEHDRDAYTAAKGDFIRQCTAEARRWPAQKNRAGEEGRLD